MKANTADGGSGVVDETVTASFTGPGWVEIVESLDVADRVHVELQAADGTTEWVSDWVQDTGSKYAEFGEFRLELTCEEQHTRLAMGDGGVKLLQETGGEWSAGDSTPLLNSLEAVPRDAFEREAWFVWEVTVSEVKGGGISTDQTVCPEAPTREAAVEKAKRWAGVKYGYTPGVCRDCELTAPDQNGRENGNTQVDVSPTDEDL